MKCGNKASVTYEIKNRLPNKLGNHYPPRDKIYMVVSKTANSNQDLSKVILKKVILPGVGMDMDGNCDHQAGLLWDQFKSHLAPVVKEYCKQLEFLKVIISPGGLTPVGQPLDKAINKVFKSHFWDKYDKYILQAEVVNGCPKAPPRQLLAKWVVEAWEMIPEELMRKAWTSCRYTP